MHFNITLAIIVVTCLISVGGFYNDNIKNDLIFYPPAITERKQWYRFITCGFIHADTMHLLFNMYAFYAFGNMVESGFAQIFGEKGKVLYIMLYITSLVACLLPTYFKHKDNGYYSSLGASGAVSAIVFCYIFLDPLQRVGIIFLPFDMPGFIFGILYLIISSVLAKKGTSHINHSAHIWGAVYGVVFTVIAGFTLSPYNLPARFIDQVQEYLQRFLG